MTVKEWVPNDIRTENFFDIAFYTSELLVAWHFVPFKIWFVLTAGILGCIVSQLILEQLSCIGQHIKNLDEPSAEISCCCDLLLNPAILNNQIDVA